MTRRRLSLFKTYFIDYRGRLRQLSVSFLISHDKLLYFQCTLDDQDTYSIRLTDDGCWHDQIAGPTVLADELGSLIESKLI
jgi:hypothetical protein